MKTLTVEVANPDAIENLGFADCRDPDELLNEMDRLLKVHGLELVMFDDGSDNYLFQIIKQIHDKE